MAQPEKPRSAAMALISACRELYAAIDRLDHEAATKVGITLNDLRALNELEHGPVRAGHLSSALGLTTGAVSTLIDRLEKRGLAGRMPDPDDRRVVLVAPTPKLFEELGPLYRGVAIHLARAADGYSERELASALRHLRVVIDAYKSAVEG